MFTEKTVKKSGVGMAYIILFLLLGAAIGFGVNEYFFKKEPKVIENVKTLVETDTLFLEKDKIVYRTIPKIEYINTIDTIIKTKPFIARVDTILHHRDTLKIEYTFPENNFLMELSRPLDSIIINREYETVRYIEVPKKEEWYEKWYTQLGIGLVGGIILEKTLN